MTEFEERVLDKIKAIVKSVEPSADIILFGSRSRGEANEESDFDVLIITQEEVSMAYELKFQELIYDVELEFDTLIEVFLFSKQSWEKGATPSPLIESVRKDGILI